MISLFTQIGEAYVKNVINTFYQQSFNDPIIGHFFVGKDHNKLAQQQINFAAVMLGSTKHSYNGRSLSKIHKQLNIRKPHFMRRLVLLEESMIQHKVPKNLRDKWLELEKKLLPTIIN